MSFQHGAPRAEPELVHEERDEVPVSGVAHGLVVEHAHLAGERLPESPDAARRVERLVVDPVEGEVLEALEREHLAALAVVDHLAGVAVPG